MIVTEQEAKTKRCQETIAPVATAEKVYHEGVSCIGSGCMAWRWWLSPNDRSMVRTGSDELMRDASLGYCGKAGRP